MNRAETVESVLMSYLDRYATEAVDIVKEQTCKTCKFKGESCKDKPCDIAIYLILYYENLIAGKNAQWN